jgi:DNA-binding NarL/FixJ family response regulator
MSHNLLSPIHVLVADDHKLFRDGLVATLKHIRSVGLIHQASNGREVLEILKTKNCHIVFMDINMPMMDGVEVTRKINASHHTVKVIALSMHDDQKHVVDMYDAGASGYLLKDTDRQELAEAIEVVMSGRNYYSPSISGKLVDQAIIKSKNMIPSNAGLTDREIVVLQYIYQEFTNKEIAEKMNISEKTVENFRSALMSKTGAKNVASLVKYAIRHGYTGELGT